MQRQTQILQDFVRSNATPGSTPVNPTDLAGNVAKGFDTFKAALQTSTGNLNILSEIAVQAGAQAGQLINDRVLATLDEVKAATVGVLSRSPASRALTVTSKREIVASPAPEPSAPKLAAKA